MPRHYLIVDDSVVIRQTLEKMLARFCPQGHRVSTAETSEEALQIFRKDRPDLVFMDIQLPDVDGEQTAQVMFQEDPETKVVIISGLMEDDDRIRELISAGAFDFLQKPIHSSDVKELIRLLEEEEESGAGRIH